jgi:hypothetical protein
LLKWQKESYVVREAVAPSVSAAEVARTVAVGIAGRMRNERAVVVEVGVYDSVRKVRCCDE